MENFVKLFVDLDGTVAEWKVSAKEEDLFQKGYFARLDSYENVVMALERYARENPEVYILSAYLTESRYALLEKQEWVNRHLPFVPASHRLFVPFGCSKAGYVASCFDVEELDKSFVLLDDYSKNLHAWEKHGGHGIKLLNGINGTGGTWTGASVSRFDEPGKIAKDLLCLAWDPDFTKLTPQEKAELEQAKAEIENGEYLTSEQVWGTNKN